MSTTITQEDLAAARTRVETLESEHDQLHSKAVGRLHEMGQAVEEDGAERPSAGQVEELFADADKKAQEVQDAKNLVNRLHAQRNGRDPADQRPGAHRDLAIARGIAPSLASRFFGHEEIAAAAQAGSLKDLQRLPSVPTMSAGEWALTLNPAAMVEPQAAQFDGGALVPDDQSRVSTVRGTPQRRPVLLDWIRVGTTDSDSVPYSKQTADTHTVSGKAPGIAATEATITVEGASEEVRDRTEVLPVPERNLADNGRIRSFLDGRMMGALLRDAESQVVAGDGTGENMTGIVNWTGVGTKARTSGDKLAAAFHTSITQVRVNHFDEPTGIALTAVDLENLILAEGTDGHWANHGGPFAPYPFTIWGILTAVAHALAADQAIIGVWDEDELVVRSGPEIQEYDRTLDAAQKRLVWLRGLYRATNIIERPTAFSVLTTTPVA